MYFIIKSTEASTFENVIKLIAQTQEYFNIEIYSILINNEIKLNK